MEPFPLLVDLDPRRRTSLHRQLYDHLREAILAGRIRPGARIPATRDLARDLAVSRTTVLTAVDRLVSEGFLRTRVGSGTWVSEAVENRFVGGEKESVGLASPASPLTASARSRSLARATGGAPRFDGERIPFQVGHPDVEAFPLSEWARISGRCWRSATPADLSYGDRLGLDQLREAIARYLEQSRGVRVDGHTVVVTAGAQMGLTLAAHLLLDAGDEVWFENPGYGGARGAFVAAGASLVPVPVDHDGLNVRDGQARAPRARMAYVTPSHQFPLGVTMSLERRMALLSWAREEGGWILEDDYDSEYRYEGRPIMSLQGLAEGASVVYLGTFSKTMFPGIRIGFLVVPDALAEHADAARYSLDNHPPIPHQAALAEFIEQGHLARHVRRTRDRYRSRRDALVESIERRFSGTLTIAASETGLHVTAILPEGVDDVALERSAARGGLGVLALSAFFHGSPTRPGLVFGIGRTRPDEITSGMATLAPLLERELCRARAG